MWLFFVCETLLNRNKAQCRHNNWKKSFFASFPILKNRSSDFHMHFRIKYHPSIFEKYKIFRGGRGNLLRFWLWSWDLFHRRSTTTKKCGVLWTQSFTFPLRQAISIHGLNYGSIQVQQCIWPTIRHVPKEDESQQLKNLHKLLLLWPLHTFFLQEVLYKKLALGQPNG